ncbi:unknown protein [Parachlamydia acanthamoebae UV-7]|uniref:Uncharacterized protein n=1 Tax=Parachlamydia acanthamoebae (strain UV7) TaxID=765952 RepID=F8KXU5_PARAV|nr:unknown protein [Parachlamydia acanthamoebae UV-7]
MHSFSFFWSLAEMHMESEFFKKRKEREGLSPCEELH